MVHSAVGTRVRGIALVASVVVGALTAVQARFNGELSFDMHNGLEAAVWSFGSGLLVLCVVVVVSSGIREGVRKIPRAIASGELKWWQALGGLLGGFFVGVQTATVPMLGVAVFTVAVVAGQSSNSLVVDRIGLGPAGVQRITGPRLVSAVLAIIAVTIAVSARFAAPDFVPLAVIFAFIAGTVLAVQQAINGRTARAAGHPMSATFLNFLLGSIGLTTAFLFMWLIGGKDPAPFPPVPFWFYLGGVLGILFIAVASWAVPIVGVLLFALLTIAGQLSGALILDVVAPTAGTHLTINLLVGVALAFVAILVATRGRRRT